MIKNNPFTALTRFERGLWLTSVAVILISGLFSGLDAENLLSVTASLIGVTALIFVARGQVSGQVLTVVFAVFYGVISWRFAYYGEMITYLGMTAPMAIAAVFSWLQHPYKDDGDLPKEVTVGKLNRTKLVLLWLLAIITTAIFYFILRAIGNASLLVSTISVTTSFLASALTFLRSSYYALAYAANDVVLIVLWVTAAMTAPEYLSMVLCFVMFLCNDLYGFYNWRRMEERQGGNI